MKFKVGDKVKFTYSGGTSFGVVVEIDIYDTVLSYEVQVISAPLALIASFCWIKESDIISLIQAKKKFNFLDAWDAVKEGKTVRVTAQTMSLSYTPDDFKAIEEWPIAAIEADWEIVEEENEIVTYHQVFSDGTVGSGSYPRMDHTGEKVRIAMIELTTDKNGKLLNARNIETTKV
jgi:Zn-dependent metalloprotease